MDLGQAKAEASVHGVVMTIRSMKLQDERASGEEVLALQILTVQQRMASTAGVKVLLVGVEALAEVAVDLVEATTVRGRQHVVLVAAEGDLVTEAEDLAAVEVALVMGLMMNLKKMEEALVQRSVVALEKDGVDFQEVTMVKMVVEEGVDLVAVVDLEAVGKRGILLGTTQRREVVVEEVEEDVTTVVKRVILPETVQIKSQMKVSRFLSG